MLSRHVDGQSARSITAPPEDGSIVDIDLTVVPLVTGRSAVGAYGIFRDMTEQKRAERHLRAQYAVIEALANSSTVEGAASWVLRSVAEALHWQAGVMWIVDKTANELRCVDCWCTSEIDGAQFEEETRRGRFAQGSGPGRTWALGVELDLGRHEGDRSPGAPRRSARLHAFSLPLMLDNMSSACSSSSRDRFSSRTIRSSACSPRSPAAREFIDARAQEQLNGSSMSGICRASPALTAVQARQRIVEPRAGPFDDRDHAPADDRCTGGSRRHPGDVRGLMRGAPRCGRSKTGIGARTQLPLAELDRNAEAG